MRKLYCTILLFLVAAASFAQNIKLNGRVLNQKNEPVSGATITIQGMQRSMAADVEGRFTLQLQPGKTYTITVSAAGYTTKMVEDVTVSANDESLNNVSIVLESKETLSEVVVRTTVRRESTSALLNLQRNNTALSSGLAADFIRKTPDRNTGEVLKRVSGASVQDGRFVVVRGLSDRYNAASLNNAQFPSTEPDRKSFSFDVIPSILVDNIIVNKTATPDLTGEFAGGLVQVQTKDVPTRNTLTVGVSLGYNTQSTFKDFVSNERNSRDWIGFDDRTRSIPKGFPTTPQAYRALGANAAGINQQVQFGRLFNNDVYRQQQSTAAPIQTYNLAWGNAKTFKNSHKFGTILSLTYRKSQLRYEVERRLSEQDGAVNTQLFDQQNRYAVNWGAMANFTYVAGKHKISFKNLFNQLFDDNYYTRSGISNDRIQDISFNSSVLNQRSFYTGQLEGEHQLTKSGIRLRWNGNASYNWKAQPDLRTSAYFRPKGSTEKFEYDDDDTRRFFSDLKDYSYGANGNVTVPFKLGKEKQTFKAGGSTLIRIRNFNSRIFRYDRGPNFQAGRQYLPFDQIFDPANIGADGFLVNDFTNNQDKYFGVSVLNGMFGMFDNAVNDKLRLVWGVRVENFQQVLTTRDVTAKRVVVETEKWDVLPSLNLTISPNSKSNIRVAGSRTVSRPEFREIAPFSFFDYEVFYAVNGNPELRRGSILNADVRYEYYPKAGEGITIGAFYKHFDDPIELRLNSSSVINRRTYEYQNADKAYSAGAELEVRKNIGGAMKDFSVFANLTYIYSRVTLNTTGAGGAAIDETRPLQGQSPYLINLGLQYNSSNGVWNGSLLYNRIGQRLALVGDFANLGIASVFEKPRNQVDLQLAKKVMKKRGEVKLTWSDMLNAEFLFYDNADSKSAYKEGNDRIFYRYKPGSTITLGFTYDFSL